MLFSGLKTALSDRTNDVSFQECKRQLMSKKDDMSFCNQTDSSLPRKMTCRFLRSSTSLLKILTRLSVQSTRQPDLTQKQPLRHYFDLFKLHNCHKSNDFMIYYLKLLKKNSKNENPRTKA